MTRKIISEDTRLKAFALFTMAAQHYRKGMEFEAAMSETLGYTERYAGCLSDALWDEAAFDEAMEKEGFVVRKRKAAA